MKNSKYFIAPLIIFSCLRLSYAQPKVILHLTGGYSIPSADLRGTYPGYPEIAPSAYFMNSGFNFSVDGKYYINKQRSMGITLGLSYNVFSTDDLGGNTDEFGNPYTVKNNIYLFTVDMGLEYCFAPKAKINPFVGAEFAVNLFNGSSTPSRGSSVLTLKPSTRFGVNFGGGIEWHIGQTAGLVLGVKYDLANLIGKKDTTESKSGKDYTLVDAAYTDVTGKSESSRSIQYIQLYAGVSFYLWAPKPKKIILRD